MKQLVAAVAVTLVVASCSDASAEPVPTAEPPPTATEVTATTLPATTPAPTSVATTVAPAPQAQAQTHEAVVAWDGTSCSYEGPAQVREGDTVDLTFRNDSDDVADYEVAYLISGHTIEELADVTGSFIDRETSTIPDFINIVMSYPGGIGSLGGGDSATEAFEVEVPRVHTFTCFGGRVTGDQTVDVADTGFEVSE